MARGDETYHRVSAHEEETMATAIEVDSDRLEMLRSAFSGTLLQPDDDGYDEARSIHNGLIDRRPALIARCQGAADVAEAIRFAREKPISISASAAAATTSPVVRSSTTRS